jgi:hypothetical protein
MRAVQKSVRSLNKPLNHSPFLVIHRVTLKNGIIFLNRIKEHRRNGARAAETGESIAQDGIEAREIGKSAWLERL